MSYTAEELVKIAVNFEQLTAKALVILAKKKDEKSNSKAKGKKKMPPWLKGKDKKSDSNQAKDKKSDKKSKKASEYYDGILSKFGQTTTNPDGTVTLPPFTTPGGQEPKAPKGTPGNPYTQEELGNDMELGEGNVDEEGNAIRQPVSFQRGQQASKFTAIPPAVQEALHKLQKYKGKDGKPLVMANGKGDGQLGPNTQFALDQYRADNKDRAVDIHGQPISQELMYEMIKRDASGENKPTEQRFNAKTTLEALNAAQAYVTQLEASLRGGQISAKNAAQTKQALDQYLKQMQQHVVGIYSTLQDNRSSQQERDSATQMQQKYDGLRATFERWTTYLDTLAKQAPPTMTDDNPYGQPAQPAPAQSNAPTPSTQT